MAPAANCRPRTLDGRGLAIRWPIRVRDCSSRWRAHRRSRHSSPTPGTRERGCDGSGTASAGRCTWPARRRPRKCCRARRQIGDRRARRCAELDRLVPELISTAGERIRQQDRSTVFPCVRRGRGLAGSELRGTREPARSRALESESRSGLRRQSSEIPRLAGPSNSSTASSRRTRRQAPRSSEPCAEESGVRGPRRPHPCRIQAVRSAPGSRDFPKARGPLPTRGTPEAARPGHSRPASIRDAIPHGRGSLRLRPCDRISETLAHPIHRDSMRRETPSQRRSPCHDSLPSPR